MEQLQKGDIIQLTVEVSDEVGAKKLYHSIKGGLESDTPTFNGCYINNVMVNDDIGGEINTLMQDFYSEFNARFNTIHELLIKRRNAITNKPLRATPTSGAQVKFATTAPIIPEDLSKNEDIFVLCVDDDASTHTTTELVLRGLKLPGYNVKMLSARSAKEAIYVLQDAAKSGQNIAVCLLDIIMESDDAGYKVLNYIRNDGEVDSYIRVVARSGQPGIRRTESDIIQNYDVDDYIDKADLRAAHLRNSILLHIRTFVKFNSRISHLKCCN